MQNSRPGSAGKMAETRCPPYYTKVVKYRKPTNRAQRVRAIVKARYNTFLLKARDVDVDLLTDSGTGAMLDTQKGAAEEGDESYAGSESYDKLEEAVRDVFGYPYVVPAHQGRGAEHLMSRALITKPGGFTPMNLYFTTSRVHAELAGGRWVSVAVPEALLPESNYPYKGNIDINRLGALIEEVGAENIPFVRIEASMNMAGGQPFSMDNIRAVSRLCERYEIFFLLDATRLVENAYFIQHLDSAWERYPIRDIVRYICAFTDGYTMSSKKDHFVPVGGFLATRNKDVYERARGDTPTFEGLHTYGGMSGATMEALAVGMRASVEKPELVEHYVEEQVGYLHRRLREMWMPVAMPSGAHAVCIDAKRFLPHIPQSEYPAQTLAAEIYIEGGVRTMERDIVSGQHGNEPYDGLELVRLTIPRLGVYSREHLDYVADVVEAVWERRDLVRGLHMTHNPQNDLRFFQAEFERL